MNFSFCPRCAERSYEHLPSYSYCINCNYSPTTDEQYEHAIPAWALAALKENGEDTEAILLVSKFSTPLVGFVSRQKDGAQSDAPMNIGA